MASIAKGCGPVPNRLHLRLAIAEIRRLWEWIWGSETIRAASFGCIDARTNKKRGNYVCVQALIINITEHIRILDFLIFVATEICQGSLLVEMYLRECMMLVDY